MFSFFRTRERALRATTTAAAGISANPIIVDPTADQAVQQRQSRLGSIRNYIRQRAEEGRPIDPDKLKHLQDEAAELTARLRRDGVEV